MCGRHPPPNLYSLLFHFCRLVLRQADTDAQEKAVLALQKLFAAGVLAGDGSSGGCAVDVIGRELETLRQRCREGATSGAEAEAEAAEGMTAEGCAAVSALQSELRQ